jgi:hypothetical protein
MVVVIGGIFTFFVKGDEHGIPIVRPPDQIFLKFRFRNRNKR